MQRRKIKLNLEPANNLKARHCCAAVQVLIIQWKVIIFLWPSYLTLVRFFSSWANNFNEHDKVLQARENSYYKVELIFLWRLVFGQKWTQRFQMVYLRPKVDQIELWNAVYLSLDIFMVVFEINIWIKANSSKSQMAGSW